MVTEYVSKFFTKLFGSRNERLVKAYARRVAQIGEFEPEMRKLSDSELRAKTEALRKQFAEGRGRAAILPHALAVAREVMDRAVGIRNIFNPEHEFDVSLLPEAMRKVHAELSAKAAELEAQPVKGGEPAPGWMQIEIPPELYEAVREIYPRSRPPFRARPFDVQLIGGMVLAEGKIAEMKTGEGKTIVAPLACYLAAIESLQCNVVTVNDYLVQRDRDWVFPFHHWLGLTVGTIHPQHMQHPRQKAEAYECDVVYGTNAEFGFDYLRDNMKLSVAEQVQKRRDFCIIDEVDSILIDEARTPLIISGPAHANSPRYGLADQLARHLLQKQRQWDQANERVTQCMMRVKALEGDIRNAREKAAVPAMREEMNRLREQDLPRLEADRDQYTQYYEVERDKKAAHLTHEGVAEAQRVAGIGSFYVGNNIDMPHLLENALRAHAVYQRDKDYVVQDGEVIIVDENTGRLMIGRQWSDGLHQSVEAKEKVKIKEETQTLATVTIQNFFKTFKRLAGMTGTAMTEATEFNDIYKLEVVSIPTNLPVQRVDREDLIFLSAKDKWNAILDEIKRMNDLGRPVLVGTTSVEKSETLSRMLTQRHGVKHAVLNAKQHEREAHIVGDAGMLGAVMIATNMAGRGTDIKLRPISREELIDHWKRRNLVSADATPDMPDDEIIQRVHRHLCRTILGMKHDDVTALSPEEAELKLLRFWVADNTFAGDKAERMDHAQCLNELDKVPDFMLHRLSMWSNTEEMGGLHIVGTERHESRRIDNQLRGRSGRQGDQGSSRFFISLEDDLMKMFAGKTTMSALSRLGMKEGDAIEHKWITRSVERAQRKVEERNYQIRKNLLEYDEVMNHQRTAFYDIRQTVLEGRDVDQIIFSYIADSAQDAIKEFLNPDYRSTQIAEWCRAELDVSAEPGRLSRVEDDLNEMIEELRGQARAEIQSIVETSLGEYMSRDIPEEDWDLRGLSAWAMNRFGVNLPHSRLKKMSPAEVRDELIESAQEQAAKKDFSGVAKYLEPLYPESMLAEWANQKFNVELKPEELKLDEKEMVADLIVERARESYKRREIHYPVEFVLEMAFNAAQQDGEWAAKRLSEWVEKRFEERIPAETMLKTTAGELQDRLIQIAEQYHADNRLEKLCKAKVDELTKADELSEWIEGLFEEKLPADELEPLDREGRLERVLEAGRKFHRRELAELERFVLLQILDSAWKDHLYAMDQLKDSVGLAGYAQQDPRIEYKRRGSELFMRMQSTVRDRVTNLIFRARLSPGAQVRNVYGDQTARQQAAPDAYQGGQSGDASGAGQEGPQMQQAESQVASRRERRAAASRKRDDARGRTSRRGGRGSKRR
ncbi:MAG: preprotein translocase subunit SecA [Phycisphaeraceae bacterium]|nr:preprotein translocase subunit SecA [Phycisphaeraceae bacterium]